MEKKEIAGELFARKFHCSQAVLAAFAEDFGITRDQALKLGGCLSMGMRKGEVCGACSGALMALGLKYGQCREEDLETRAKANIATNLLLDRFAEKNGSYICNELLGCDVRTDEGIEYAINNLLFTEFCPKMVESAVEITEQIMSELE